MGGSCWILRTFLCEVPSASPESMLIGWRPLLDGGRMPLMRLLVRSKRVAWPPWRVRPLCRCPLCCSASGTKGPRPSVWGLRRGIWLRRVGPAVALDRIWPLPLLSRRRRSGCLLSLGDFRRQACAHLQTASCA
ncbi:hypothetical protein K443DRAFT_327491 [Laccaria amethystina LaAM-08-1]|jgi:hypothetical protein|uniref:Uncharacterized protein n=1 Tax=Laccaria amethystina LaAM-08-1 TaxID=1095629 RepID=A0A0C9Y6G7_9AGAR|nr:hypothetical protein K443DRAFT_327491 [Laccaria amethystina LaAM-08-1]